MPIKTKMADVKMLGLDECTPLFQAAAEATEEAIWNALVGAETMTGYKGHTAHAIPHDKLKAAAAKYHMLRWALVPGAVRRLCF